MPATKKIFLRPGDGIGHEVTRAMRKVIDWFQAAGRTNFEITEMLIGGASYNARSRPLTEDTLAQAKASDAVLLACIGGPNWDTLPCDLRPEKGLLRIRKEMDLYANLRLASVFGALAGVSSLKSEVVKGLDVMIVRELIGGLYFGQRRGIEMDKANVLESSIVWREDITKLHAAEFSDVALNHMYVDTYAMHLARALRDFDVIVTENLFGDILSDLASTLTGSLGMLPSASLGEADASGHQPAIYVPVHGSAPDITGKGLAIPWR